MNFLSQLITKLVLEKVRKQSQQDSPKQNLVCLPSLMLWIGSIGGIFFLALAILMGLGQGGWFFLIFVAFALILVLGWRNCRIWYTDTEFTVGYLLGYKRTFRYEEIQSIQGRRNITLKVRGKTVQIDELALGRQAFLQHIRRKYRTAFGRNIPVIQKSKWDPFNGHVDNAGELVAVYLLIAALPLGAMLWMLLGSPIERDIQYIQTPIRLDIADSSELAFPWDGKTLTISDPSELLPREEFAALCRSGEVFTVGYWIAKNDSGEITSYKAEYLADCQGRIWFTPELAWKSAIPGFLLVFGVIELIWLAYCGLSIYVGRNPQKFSKKFVHSFFKDGYIHF